MARQKKEKTVAPKLEDFALPSDPASRKVIAEGVAHADDAAADHARRRGTLEFLGRRSDRDAGAAGPVAVHAAV